MKGESPKRAQFTRIPLFNTYCLVTITTLGGERRGIYLPKDVVREMDIGPRQKAVIKLLTRRRMVIEV